MEPVALWRPSVLQRGISACREPVDSNDRYGEFIPEAVAKDKKRKITEPLDPDKAPPAAKKKKKKKKSTQVGSSCSSIMNQKVKTAVPVSQNRFVQRLLKPQQVVSPYIPSCRSGYRLLNVIFRREHLLWRFVDGFLLGHISSVLMLARQQLCRNKSPGT